MLHANLPVVSSNDSNGPESSWEDRWKDVGAFAWEQSIRVLESLGGGV